MKIGEVIIVELLIRSNICIWPLKFLLPVIVSVFHSRKSHFFKVDMSINKHWDN